MLGATLRSGHLDILLTSSGRTSYSFGNSSVKPLESSPQTGVKRTVFTFCSAIQLSPVLHQSNSLSTFPSSIALRFAMSDSYGDFWDNDELTSVDPSDHGVSKFEAYLYYYGLRGSSHNGPKLIYRTSTDIFSLPSGPWQDLRMMQLLTVHDHAKLSQNNLWATVRDKVRDLLDA
jgi:hypothetical protein